MDDLERGKVPREICEFQRRKRRKHVEAESRGPVQTERDAIRLLFYSCGQKHNKRVCLKMKVPSMWLVSSWLP